MRFFTATLIAASLLTVFVPVASAEPQCLEVYPWSKLCEGDVAGFVDSFGILSCELKECVTLTSANPLPQPDCIQAVPYSYLCSGDVETFLAYYLGDVVLA